MMKRIAFALIGLGLLACSKEVITHKFSTEVRPMNGGTVAPPNVFTSTAELDQLVRALKALA
ncbi:hypothetical protein PQG44_09405 [Aquirufa sp. LEPPI-3A]|uniref:hypothetical protein n=1 Tax=Aquirufa regiilacus TaxID=3024868 RepID=UPI0028DE078C|nr:hypothetical protein [Aquirufa sp. LEPPI-3A]MDT8887893.1 hypothetical protein [Aquirufa sp. LEPPI-3A]